MPVKGDAPALPGARASARYVRISPTKARRVVNLVRGMPARERVYAEIKARAATRFAPMTVAKSPCATHSDRPRNARTSDGVPALKVT